MRAAWGVGTASSPGASEPWPQDQGEVSRWADRDQRPAIATCIYGWPPVSVAKPALLPDVVQASKLLSWAVVRAYFQAHLIPMAGRLARGRGPGFGGLQA